MDNEKNVDKKKNKKFRLEDIEYININSFKHEGFYSEVKVIDLESFKKALKFHKPKYIFRNSEYFLYYNSMYAISFLLEHKNFNDLLDYEDGISKGYLNGEEYYDGISRGFNSYKDYELNRKLGYITFEDFKKSEKLGFRNSLPKVESMIDSFYGNNYKVYSFLSKNIKRSKEADIYYLAMEKGFKDFNQFLEAVSMGFIDLDEYLDAKSKGFKNRTDYIDAKEKGFENVEEYEESKSLGINNKKTYDLYKFLKEIKNEHNLETLDEAILLEILYEIEPQKSIALNKVWEIIENVRNENFVKKRYKSWGIEEVIYHDWYKPKFNNMDDIRNYMKTTDIYKHLGEYDELGDVFIRKATNFEKCVIVDGSNVAWYGRQKKEGNKASVKNLEYVLEKLKEEGFENIMVIIDASLKHYIDDTDKLEKLIKDNIIQVAPSHREADEFIIKYAKDYNCKIISNDNFNDWKEKDEWAKKNIDNLLVKFMIDNQGNVKLS